MSVVKHMNFVTLALAIVTSAVSAAAQGRSTDSLQLAEKVEEILVTVRRSSIPVWRVTGPSSTLVLVGSTGASPFAMIGYASRFLPMAKLPEGQSVRQMMPPDQFDRPAALRQRGLLKPGFERTHPLHLALSVHGIVDGKKGFGPNAEDYVKRAFKKYKLRRAPIPRRNVKQPINALLSSKPEAHIPCLL